MNLIFPFLLLVTGCVQAQLFGGYSYDYETDTVESYPNGHIYQDLTVPIDNFLRENSTFDRDFIKASLNFSQSVFYSTDLLLNDIEKMIPVIQLLNSLQPPQTSHKIILALKSMENDALMQNRFYDKYFNMTMKFGNTTCNMIGKHVSTILMDFRIDACKLSYVEKPNGVETNFERFWCYYCNCNENPKLLGTGVLLNLNQTGFPCVSNWHSLSSGQPIGVHLRLPSYHGVYENAYDFKKALAKKTNVEQFMKSENSELTFYISIDKPPTVNDLTSTWAYGLNKDLFEIIRSSQWYNQVVNQIIDKVHSENLFLILKHIKAREFSFGRYMNNVVLENPIQFFSNTSQITESSVPQTSLVCFLNDIDPRKFEFCDVMNICSASNHSNLGITAETWRLMAIYVNGFHPGKLGCVENLKDKYVTIYYGNTIDCYLNSCPENWTPILQNVSKLDGLEIQTLSFDEEVIKYVPGVDKFINKWSEKFEIACIVDFSPGHFRSLLQLKKNGQFEDSWKTLCAPVFEKVSTFTWKISGEETFSDLAAYDIYVVAQTLFLIEFPEKRVIFSFTTNYDISKWQKLHGVPVMFEQ